MSIKKLAAMTAIVIATQTAYAEDFIDITPFMGNVNGAAGIEFITPQFLEQQNGQGSCNATNGCAVFRFKVSSAVTGTSSPTPATHLYTTPAKLMKFPGCPNGSSLQDDGLDYGDRYVRIGNKMGVAIELISRCEYNVNTNNYYWEDKRNTYVYLSDVSSGNGTTQLYTYTNFELVGFDAGQNLNGSGSGQDFVLAVWKDTDSNQNMLVEGFEPNTLNRYLRNTIVVDR